MLKEDVDKFSGTAVFIRTKDGFSKFGIAESITDEYMVLRYFVGRTVLVMLDNIDKIRPFKKDVGGYYG